MAWNEYCVLSMPNAAGFRSGPFHLYRTQDVSSIGACNLRGFGVIRYRGLEFYKHGLTSEEHRLWGLLPGGRRDYEDRLDDPPLCSLLYVYDGEDEEDD